MKNYLSLYDEFSDECKVDLSLYVSPHDMPLVHRIFDDIRKQFPCIEPFSYEEKIRNIINQKVWDVLATLENKYEKEAEFTGEKIAKEK